MSSLTESLAKTRHAELYTGCHDVPAPRRSLFSRLARPLRGQPGGRRSRAGWLLVGLGLRLALPGSRHASGRTTVIGR
jgi:hypothetical protein